MLLNVARIEVVDHVVDSQASAELDAVTVKGKVDGVLKLSVEGQEDWESPGLVFGADEVPVFIQPREGKARVHVEDRHKVKLMGQADHIPEQAAIGRIGRERAVLVGPDKRIGEVSEELVVVIEFAASTRVNVAGKYSRSLIDSPTEHRKKLAVALPPGVEQG